MSDEGKEIQPKHEENQLANLTEQNWLFINAFLQCGSVKRAYKIAGYKGDSSGAPYELFRQLKSKIEALGDLDVTSRARLQADLAQVLNLPLADSKKELTLSEWLRVRKFVASITPEATQAKPQISVLVINRPAAENGKGPESNSAPTHSPQNDVIEAEIVDPKP